MLCCRLQRRHQGPVDAAAGLTDRCLYELLAALKERVVKQHLGTWPAAQSNLSQLLSSNNMEASVVDGTAAQLQMNNSQPQSVVDIIVHFGPTAQQLPPLASVPPPIS
jgi:hypothetical protein